MSRDQLLRRIQHTAYYAWGTGLECLALLRGTPLLERQQEINLNHGHIVTLISDRLNPPRP